MSKIYEAPFSKIPLGSEITDVSDKDLLAVEGLKKMWWPLWNDRYVEPFKQTLQEMRENDPREPPGKTLSYPIDDLVFNVSMYTKNPNPKYGDAFGHINNFIKELKAIIYPSEARIHPEYVHSEGRKLFVKLPKFLKYVTYHYERVRKPEDEFSISYSDNLVETLEQIIKDYSHRLAALSPKPLDEFNYENACRYIAARTQIERTEAWVKSVEEFQKDKVRLSEKKLPIETTRTKVVADKFASEVLSYQKTRLPYKKMLEGLIEYLEKIRNDKDYALSLQYDNEKAVVFIEDVPYLRLAHITRKIRMLRSAESQVAEKKLEQRLTTTPAEIPGLVLVL